MRRNPPGVLGDPAQRQQAHVVVVFIDGRHLVEGFRRTHYVVIADHRPLGTARRARSVAEYRHVVRAAARHLLLETRRLAPGQRPALPAYLFVGHQPRLVVRPQAPLIPVNDALHLGDLRPHRQHLVDLLLVLRQYETCITARDDVRGLLRRGVGEQPHLHPAHRQQSEIGPQVPAIVVADCGNVLTPFQAQRVQPQTKHPHLLA